MPRFLTDDTNGTSASPMLMTDLKGQQGQTFYLKVRSWLQFCCHLVEVCCHLVEVCFTAETLGRVTTVG